MEKGKPPREKDTIAEFPEMEKGKPPREKDTIAELPEREKGKPPREKDTKAEFPEMEKGKPPHEKDTLAENQTKKLTSFGQQEPSAPPFGSAPPLRNPILTLVKLTDSEIREALYNYKGGFCCYGSKFIKDMILTDIYEDCAFHYKLESFGEKRESSSAFTGYYGQIIDGPENGPPPDLWDIPVELLVKFVDQIITQEIPHTAYVKTCHTCDGDGKVECKLCSGRGKTSCISCFGNGRDKDGGSCFSCRGTGYRRCATCSETGKVDCSTCSGHGKLKWYMLLIVTWKTHVDTFVSNKESLPKELIYEASGREIFNYEGDKVEMIAAPDRIITEASAVLIEKHKSSFRDELIIAQRHNLRAVPFTKARYVWRDKKGEFYVYSFEKKVHFEDFPQQCCRCAIF